MLGRGPGGGASLSDWIFWFPLVTHICNEAVNMVSSVGSRLDPPVGQGDDELPLDIALQGNIDITPPSQHFTYTGVSQENQHMEFLQKNWFYKIREFSLRAL